MRAEFLQRGVGDCSLFMFMGALSSGAAIEWVVTSTKIILDAYTCGCRVPAVVEHCLQVLKLQS